MGRWPAAPRRRPSPGDLAAGTTLAVHLLANSAHGTKQAVLLVLNPGREEERVERPGPTAIAEVQGPEPADHDRLLVRRPQRALEFPILGVVGVDAAVAEVADQEGAAELTELLGSQRQPPGRVESASRGEPLQKVALGVEDVHE